MSPAQIVAWFQVVVLILEYGKKVVDLAVEIYEKIESKFKAEGGKEKAKQFDKLFIKEAVASPVITGMTLDKAVQNVDKIREKVWATRNENLYYHRKKACPGPIR